jgi:hypothetical protein
LSLYPTAPEDPESRAVDADLIRRAREKMTEKDARIVWDKSIGKPHNEIGPDHDMSDDAVSSRLQRLRGRFGC